MPNATPIKLNTVLASLPESCYERPTRKGIAWLARDLLLYVAALAGLFATDSPWLLVPFWVLAGMSISALFVLGHDAAHGALFDSKRLCYVLGQIAMLPSLHLYEAWVFGHNRIHHGHTTRQGMDYVWHPLTPEGYAALSRLGKLGHRIKWSAFGAGVYYMHEIWFQKMLRFPGGEKMAPLIRHDRLVVGTYAVVVSLIVLIAGAIHYETMSGALWMWVKLLAVPYVVFSYFIGWAVYVHHISPEIPWYSRRAWSKFKGQVEGTTILHVPSLINFFAHDIMLHVPHHVDMRIPFYHLAEACDALRAKWGDHIVERDYKVRDYLVTTSKCKLFDFEKGEWQNYQGETTSSPRLAEADAA